MANALEDSGFENKALKTFIQFIWASEMVRSRVYSQLSKYGLTGSQFGVLDALFHMGHLPQSDLGKNIFKSGGNITMVVDNLEKNELVRRERSEKDRRVINVHLTDKGRKLFTEVLPVYISIVEEEMNALTKSELGELGRLCVKLGISK